jgi:hypothetical protein
VAANVVNGRVTFSLPAHLSFVHLEGEKSFRRQFCRKVLFFLILLWEFPRGNITYSLRFWRGEFPLVQVFRQGFFSRKRRKAKERNEPVKVMAWVWLLPVSPWEDQHVGAADLVLVRRGHFKGHSILHTSI